MWALGAGLLILAVTAFAVALGWRAESDPPPALWEPRAFASTYTSVIGPIAAFSVASAIFIAGVSVSRHTQAFQTVVGMLLLAYLMLTGVAMTFASTPSAASPDGLSESMARVQRFTIALATLSYLCSISVAWLALRPLLIAIELDELGRIFSWVLLVTVVAAAFRPITFLQRYLGVSRMVAVLTLLVGMAAAAFYRLALVWMVPDLWPVTDAELLFSIVLFAVVSVGFAAQSLSLASQGGRVFDRVLKTGGHRFALGYYAAAVTALGLLWFAVSDLGPPA